MEPNDRNGPSEQTPLLRPGSPPELGGQSPVNKGADRRPDSRGSAGSGSSSSLPDLERVISVAEDPGLPGPSVGGGVVGSGTYPEDGDDEASHHQPPREGIPELAAKIHLIIPAIGIGVFLSALDQLLTVTIYARIGSELNALNSTGWIATAYFLTLTSVQPLYGKLSDIFGRKECLLFSYTVFGLGCLWCGLAPTMNQLIVARGVAGIGGGGMASLVSILLTDIVPLRDRGVYQGYINITYAFGSSLGAPLGGLLADSVGWRWSFIGQAPICLAAFVAVYLILDLPKADHSHWLKKLRRVDFLGAFFLVSAVFCLLLALDSGSNEGWSKRFTVVSLAISPFLFVAFVLVEMRVASHPFAPGHVIFDKSLVAAYLCNFFSVAGQMPIWFFLPLLYQAYYSMSTVSAGLLFIPGSVAGVVSSLGSGFIMRRTGRYYHLTIACYAVLLLSLVPLTLSSGLAGDSRWGTTLGLVLGSVGIGGGLTTTLVALISNAAHEDSAVVIACSYLFRSLGSSIGVSVTSAVLQQVLRRRLAAELGSGEEAGKIEERVRESLDYIGQLEPGVAGVVRGCYRYGVMVVFMADLVFLVPALVSSFFIKEKVVPK